MKKDLYEREHCCQNTDCLLHNIPLCRDRFAALLGYWVKELGTYKTSKGKHKGKLVYNEARGIKRLLNKTYHTQEHRTVATELCSVGSLDPNPEGTRDSMTTQLSRGQEKTGSRKTAGLPDRLSKLGSLTGNISPPVNLPGRNDTEDSSLLNATYTRFNSDRTNKSSGDKRT